MQPVSKQRIGKHALLEKAFAIRLCKAIIRKLLVGVVSSLVEIFQPFS
jgi:hypothetical protein